MVRIVKGYWIYPRPTNRGSRQPLPFLLAAAAGGSLLSGLAETLSPAAAAPLIVGRDMKLIQAFCFLLEIDL